MKNLKILLATTAVVSLLSFAAQASEGKQEWAFKKEEAKASDTRMYVTGGVAYVKGKAKVNSFKSQKFSDAEFLLGLGAYINENVRADVTLNYMPKTELTKGIDVGSYGAMVNGYYHWPVGSDSFSPYSTVGLGYSKNKVSSGKTSYKASNFAWQVGGGVSGPLSETLTWDLGYRYTDKGKLAKASGITSSSLTSHSILVSVRAAL